MGESDAECDDSRTVLTVEVQLKPDSEYRLWLNRNANKNFASSDGGVLPDTEYVFYTWPGIGPATTGKTAGIPGGIMGQSAVSMR